MADDAAQTTNGEGGGSSIRSPSFPFIDLETAIGRAAEFYEREKRNSAPLEVAVGHWGYSSKSSGGKQTTAALRAYGLLAGRGRVSLTPRALKIVVQGAPDRDKAVREAALAPDEFKKLWEVHGAELPSDQSLRHDLVINRGYNENSVDDFIKNYKNTVAYARLDDSASMSVAGSDPEETDIPPEGADMHAQDAARKPPPSPPPRPFVGDLPPVTFPLPRGNVVEIRLKKSITAKEFNQLKQLFDLLGPSFIEEETSKEDQDRDN